MMAARRRGEVSRAFAAGRFRTLLGCTTALTALAGIAGAHAQAPLATPAGGVVVAGSAHIAQAPGATSITQGTQRAAINWQSFNVGSRATVSFQQPNSQAVTLNRVMAPDPSTIAGRITANGSIVLVNPNGVVFANGSEVNAAGLVVSVPGITNRNFMAGRMVFDQPGNPNARIVNRGSITIAQAGLAALVAPQVANSGVIAAKLGSVVLAGARTATLDLYGDGLVSLDVQGAVKTLPVGPDGKKVKALVTNSGTIVAEGGTVLLTAKAVDGLIQNLVDAGGTVSANGVVGRPAGTVLVQGVGGSIRIAGTLTADGEGARGTGGAVGLDASGGVTIADTARIAASGPAGGGVVAVGTTLERAGGGPGTSATLTAEQVLIAPGATISADATEAGNGGRVTVLSTVQTTDHGSITVEGGRQGGNGGFVEISGHDLALDGSVNTGAPMGEDGSILLDPFNLQIVLRGTNNGDVGFSGVPFSAGSITPGTTDTVSASALESLFTGTVTVQAINNLEVSTNLSTNPTLAVQSLLLEAGNSLIVDPGVSVSASGNLVLAAASPAIPGFTPSGALIMNGVLTAGGNLDLSAGTGGIQLGNGVGTNGSVSSTSAVGVANLTTSGGISQASGIVSAATLSGSASLGVSLTDVNDVGALGSFSTPGGFTFNNLPALSVVGPVSGGTVVVRSGDNLAISSGVAVSASGNLDLEASSPSIPGATTTGQLNSSGTISAGGNISLSAGSLGMFLFGPVAANAATGTVRISTPGFADLGGPLTAGTFTGTASRVISDSVSNVVGTLGPFVSPNGFTLNDTTNLTIAGTLAASAGFVSLGVAGSLLEAGGAILAGTFSGSSGGAALLAGNNAIGTLEGFTVTAAGNFDLVDSVPLTLTAPVSVLPGETIALRTDGLTEGSSFSSITSLIVWGALLAPGGEVSLEPFTPTVPVALVGPGAQPLGTLALNNSRGGLNGVLDVIDAGTLALTSFGSEPITVSGANPLGGLTNPHTGAASGVGTLRVSAGGTFSEAPGASLDVGVVEGDAAAVLLGGPNAIATLDGFSSAGGFVLDDTETLTVLGAVDAPSGISLTILPGNLLIGSSVQNGTLATRGAMSLTVPNGIISGGNGSVTAATLTGTALGIAALPTADVSTLGSFSVAGAAGEFALISGIPLTVNGPVSAAFLDIAGTGALTLAGNLFTTGLPLASQSGASPALPGSVLQVLPGIGGAFQQLGTSAIAPLGGGSVTVRIQLPSAGGTASFANLQAGAANLVLALGSGRAAGTMASGSLLVIGTGGSANLFGSVGGIFGGAAAGIARIQPAISVTYLFNGCVIGTAICGLTIALVPQGSPNLVGTYGGPSLSPVVSLPAIVLLTIPAVVGESWTDAGGFPLPNIARLDF